MAQVSGPVTGGARGWPFGATRLDLERLGYEEEEYFLSGSACRYRPASGTVFGPDGLWSAEPAGEAPFTTRLLIYRPRDKARFNGTVILTWNNVTAGYELFGTDSLELFEGGFALVCVSAQKAGIEGLPPVRQGLRQWDGERYGALSVPSDDYSFDVFTQAARAVGPDRDRQGIDPMAGLDVQRVVAQGASQSAGRLATYVNAVAPLARAIDGFILAIYFGRGTPLEVGDTVVNIHAPAQGSTTRRRLRGENRLRDDLGVPIFIVNSELEAIACYDVRQPDSESFRTWEVAGTCHISRQSMATRTVSAQRDELVTRKVADAINAVPMNPVYDAAFHHMHRWLCDGVPPPSQPRVDIAGSPPAAIRDEHGIAKGGIRLPQVQAPLAQNSAIPLTDDVFGLLGGSSQPLTVETIRGLYGSRTAFLARFRRACDGAVEAAVIRPREVAKLIAEAEAGWPAEIQ